MKRAVLVLLGGIFLISIQLLGHGFIADTAIDNFGHKPSSIKTVCRNVARRKKQYVASWDDTQSLWHRAGVRAVGHAHINRAITISFDNDNQHDLTCSPSQSFYNLNTQCWVPAYQLKTGGQLLCQSEQSVCVHTVVCHKKRTTTYLLEIKKTHTFCVGHYRVLTHNTPLAYAVMLGLTGSFGSGAAAGGATGSFFGPITAIGGFMLGGIVMVGASCLLNRGKIQRYDMLFNTHDIDYMFEHGLHEDFTQSIQIMLEPSKGNSHVHPVIPPEDIRDQGCGYLKPPALIATGCGQKAENADVSELPTGCFDIPAELEDQRRGTGCVQGSLMAILAQENIQKERDTRYEGPWARNWKEFFNTCPVGQKYKTRFKNTGKQNPKDGAPIYEVLEDIPGTDMFEKGNLLAPDRYHKGDHFEVWNEDGIWIGVANLDGSLNEAKSNAENDPNGRNIKKIL